MTYDYSLTIEEEDGFPSVSVSKLKVPNGTLLENPDGSASLDIPTMTGDLINDENYIPSDPTGVSGADIVTNIISLTQAEYDAIVSKNASTLYVIT